MRYTIHHPEPDSNDTQMPASGQHITRRDKMKINEITEAIRECIMQGDAESITGYVQQALDAGMPPVKLINEVLNPILKEVGDLFDCGDLYLPELIIASEAMEAGLAVLQPILEASHGAVETAGKVVMATIKGDVHDIGKNIVCSMLKANGFEVIDMGRDIAPADIVHRHEQEKPDIIEMSSLLTTSLPFCANTVELLTEKDIREKFHVFLGGGAATPQYAQKLGSHYGGAHAEEAVRLMKQVMGKG